MKNTHLKFLFPVCAAILLSFNAEATQRLPATVTSPVAGGNKVVSYTYNSAGHPIAISVVAPKNDGTGTNETRNYSLSYNSLGLLTEIDGAKYSSSFNDKTTYSYSTTGQLASVTNGLNQTVTYSDFGAYGKPYTITDPSGRKIKLTYDGRGRVLTMSYYGTGDTTTSETVTFVYDNVGNLTQMTYPQGNYIKAIFDSANRLTEIDEYDENNTYRGKMVYTLDNMSNMTAVQLFDSQGNVIRTTSAQYDSSNRLYKSIGALNQTNTYTYDKNSNLTNINDAIDNNTTNTYDALNRVSQIVSPDGGTTHVSYYPDDNIASIIDPKNLTTTYTYNGFGELIKLNSPDTGISTMTHDADGNITSYTDARGQNSTYTYDVLDRLTSVTYTGHTSENVTLTYDSCTNGVGKLCSLTDNSGTTSYSYNNKGRISSKNYTNTIGTNTFNKTVVYSYNSFGQLSSMTYPSGLIINYTYSNNQVVSESYNPPGGSNTTLLSNATYDPLQAQTTGFTWGNNSASNPNVYTRTFNTDGVISSINNTGANTDIINKTYGYDTRYNINSISDSVHTDRSSSATYDANSRILNYQYGTNNSHTFTYNTSDDRLTDTFNSNSATNFNYPAFSHKLNSLSGNQTDSMTYDSNGNITGFLGATLNYNADNRLNSYTKNSVTTSYLVNYLGQRTYKSNINETKYFMYDEAGNIVGEYDSSGNTLSEYVYFNGLPVGIYRNNNLYYVYDDHLGTPRAVTDSTSANNLVWIWENSEVFGNNLPNETISGSTFTFNFRFSGQYFDKESNLNYNYFRDYNPNWGRYMKSDPIGLNGGINTYAYAENNSIEINDIFGLDPKNTYILSPRNSNNPADQLMYNYKSNNNFPSDILAFVGHATYKGIEFDLDSEFAQYINKDNPDVQRVLNKIKINGTAHQRGLLTYTDFGTLVKNSSIDLKQFRGIYMVACNYGSHGGVQPRGLSKNLNIPILASKKYLVLNAPFGHPEQTQLVGYANIEGNNNQIDNKYVIPFKNKYGTEILDLYLP